MSTRSVSFKEPVVYETYDLPSSKSQQSTVISATHHDSVLDRLGRDFLFIYLNINSFYLIVIPPPEEYQHNYYDLEKRNQLLNDEVKQLRLNNRVKFNLLILVFFLY